jgi:hypothetical protein
MFSQVWLPNIVCTVGGIIISGLIGYCMGRRSVEEGLKHTRMLTNMLKVMEERGLLSLVRDEHGEVTGGRAYVIQAEAGKFTLTGYPPTIEQGPANQG